MRDQQISNALRLNDLKLPTQPQVVSVEWEVDEDSSGDESLYIVVILDDSTTDQELEKAPIHRFKSAIIDSLDKHGVDLFPYIYFERQSEHEPLTK